MSIGSAAPWLLAPLLSCSILGVGCGIEEAKRKARANGVRAAMAHVHGHFESEAATICAELPMAETAIVPPLETDCSRGCSCPSTPAEKRGASTYDCSQWAEREWRLLHFAGWSTEDAKPLDKEYFHYQASWRKTAEGCRLELKAFGDLDGDGVHATYTSWIETGADGLLAADLPEVDVLWKSR